MWRDGVVGLIGKEIGKEISDRLLYRTWRTIDRLLSPRSRSYNQILGEGGFVSKIRGEAGLYKLRGYADLSMHGGISAGM